MSDERMTEIEARLSAIEHALSLEDCPSPIVRDDGSILDCVRKDHCGCCWHDVVAHMQIREMPE